MRPDFEKMNGLVPAIIQDCCNGRVLMLGYMNEEAWKKSSAEGRVTFFSRSKQRLWTKGESSGNFLVVKEIFTDCDNDCILVKAIPQGPACHTGSESCFGNDDAKGFLYRLEQIISERIESKSQRSYTSRLFNEGVNKVAQKVGEEAVELIIEAKDNNEILFRNEAADLLYHFLILLKTKNISLEEIESVLKMRHR